MLIEIYFKRIKLRQSGVSSVNIFKGIHGYRDIDKKKPTFFATGSKNPQKSRNPPEQRSSQLLMNNHNITHSQL